MAVSEWLLFLYKSTGTYLMSCQILHLKIAVSCKKKIVCLYTLDDCLLGSYTLWVDDIFVEPNLQRHRQDNNQMHSKGIDTQ